MSNEEITITFEEDFVATRGSTYTLVFNDLISFAGNRRKWSIHEVAELRRSVATEAEHAERARIRTEFITWINSLPNPAIVHHDYFLAQLDRICSVRYRYRSPRTGISSSHTNISPSHVGEFPMITDDRNSEEPR